MHVDYDTIVVGAGPAGGTASYFLGRAGQRVLLLEREQLPRYKPCGGGLAADVLDQFPFSFEEVIESEAESLTYAMRGRIVRVPIPPGQVLMVMRDRFDALIASHARVERTTGAMVTHVQESDDHVEVALADGPRVRARHVIGADGANSAVAQNLGLRSKRRLAAAIEAEVAVPESVFRRYTGGPLFIFEELGMGYLWIFPKASHLSVGIGSFRPKRGNLRRILHDVMDHYGVRLEGCRLNGHPLPVYLGRESIATKRCLLAGDAAGLVDPFTGEGIRLAIKSGRLAAEAIQRRSPQSYAKEVHERIGRSQRLGLYLSRLFYRFPDFAWYGAIRNPFVSRAFVNLVSDRTTYVGLAATILGTFPLHMMNQLTRASLRS